MKRRITLVDINDTLGTSSVQEGRVRGIGVVRKRVEVREDERGLLCMILYMWSGCQSLSIAR